jgi:hypothetical protein
MLLKSFRLVFLIMKTNEENILYVSKHIKLLNLIFTYESYNYSFHG